MPFAPILNDLLDHAGPWARGAVFCDGEGERIARSIRDPALDAFTLDVAGASLAMVARAVAQGFPQPTLRLVHARASLHLRPLRDGYYVVVLADRGAPVTPLRQALDDAARALSSHL